MRLKTKYTRPVAALGLALFAFNVMAADATPEQLLDPTYIFRGIISLAIAAFTWYVNKLTTRIESLEKQSIALGNINLRIEHLEQLTKALRQEDSQLQSQLNLLRERVMLEYHTKDEMREHNQSLERLITELRETLKEVTQKFEALQDRFYAQLTGQSSGRRHND